MPAYLGVAHHASTSLICCSYRASSGVPAFSDSARRWKESDGRDVDTGGETAASEEAILRFGVVEYFRSAREHGARVVIRVAVESLAHTEPEADIDLGILRSIFSKKASVIRCVLH